MNEPIFSIITVTRNNAAGLALTGKSLAMQQDVPRYEWLVIDGASTDNTAEIMEQFNDGRHHFFSEPDTGIFDAMNKGLDKATGRYVWFMNAGDAFADAFALRAMAKDIQSHLGPEFIYGDAREAGRIKRALPFRSMMRGQITHHQAMLYRRDRIKDLRFDTQYKIAADYAFTLQFIATTNRHEYFPRVLCDFAPGGVSQQWADQGRRENHAIRQDILGMNALLNRIILRRDEVAFWLRRTFPRLYWRMRISSR